MNTYHRESTKSIGHDDECSSFASNDSSTWSSFFGANSSEQSSRNPRVIGPGKPAAMIVAKHAMPHGANSKKPTCNNSNNSSVFNTMAQGGQKGGEEEEEGEKRGRRPVSSKRIKTMGERTERNKNEERCRPNRSSSQEETGSHHNKCQSGTKEGDRGNPYAVKRSSEADEERGSQYPGKPISSSGNIRSSIRSSSSSTSKNGDIDARRTLTRSDMARKDLLSSRLMKSGNTTSNSTAVDGGTSTSLIKGFAGIDDVTAALGLRKDRGDNPLASDARFSYGSAAPTTYSAGSANGRSDSRRGGGTLAPRTQDDEEQYDEEEGDDLKEAALAIANPLFGDTSRSRGRQGATRHSKPAAAASTDTTAAAAAAAAAVAASWSGIGRNKRKPREDANANPLFDARSRGVGSR